MLKKFYTGELLIEALTSCRPKLLVEAVGNLLNILRLYSEIASNTSSSNEGNSSNTNKLVARSSSWH